MGTGGNNVPLIMECFGICSKDSNSMKSDNPKSGFYIAKTSRTLDANGGNPTCNQGGIAVVEGNGSRPSHHGDGYREDDVMYTLNATEQHGVAFAEPKTLKIRCGKEGGGKGALVQDNKSATLSCNNDQTLFDGTGKVVAVLENCNSVTSVLDDEKIIVYLKGSYEYDGFTDGVPNYIDPIRTVIYDAENKKELCVLDGQGGSTVVGGGKYLQMSNYG
jgi:hypothetical protein